MSMSIVAPRLYALIGGRSSIPFRTVSVSTPNTWSIRSCGVRVPVLLFHSSIRPVRFYTAGLCFCLYGQYNRGKRCHSLTQFSSSCVRKRVGRVKSSMLNEIQVHKPHRAGSILPQTSMLNAMKYRPGGGALPLDRCTVRVRWYFNKQQLTSL